jgi:hypothetical protein
MSTTDKTPKTASEDALGELHNELAKILSKSLKKRYKDKEGNDIPPPAQILNVARQFLKDNRIEALPVPGSALEELADLPVFEEDDKIIPFPAFGNR